MYHLLIVDDEIHAIRGIEAELEWDKLGISTIHTATNARQAKEVFNNHPIDIMICDIEMPEVNGLQLLAWVKEFYPSTESLFLTCHSDFHYAKEAIHLGSLDYILKPAPAYELEMAISKGTEKLSKEREQQTFNQIYHKYYKLWSAHQPLVIERFWSDLIQQRIPSHSDSIEKALANLEVPYMNTMRFLPIFIRVEKWHRDWNTREKKIIEYALQNAAGELIVDHLGRGQTLQINNGEFVCILSLDHLDLVDREQLIHVGHTYIASCNQYFHCDLSCYIGNSVAIHEVVDMLNALYECERNNVTQHNQVLFFSPSEYSPSIFVLPEMDRWQQLLNAGQKDSLLEEIRVFLNAIPQGTLDANFLHHFHHHFLQAVYFTLQMKGLQAHLIFSGSEYVTYAASAIRSIIHLQEWIQYVIHKAFEHLQAAEKNPSVIDEVKRYMSEHIDQNLTRELIANYVFLNPDYLARIFKRETGLSITDYLTEERMTLAKKLLVQTDLPISRIAERVGIPNFSYFSKQFRKYMNISPLEYRQQKLEGR